MMRATLGLILGLTLAALLGAGPAAARDLAKAAPAETARPCPAYGAGFVRLPGSRTCTRLSGRVSTGGALRVDRDGAVGVPTTAGRFAIDTRTDSDLGPVRTYVRIGNGRR